MRRTPLHTETLEERIAKRATDLLAKAQALPEDSKERRRIERRIETAKRGLANPLEPTPTHRG